MNEIGYLIGKVLFFSVAAAKTHGCDSYLENKDVLKILHTYDAKVTVKDIEERGGSEDNSNAVICRIDGKRESLTNTRLFTLDIQRNGDVRVIYNIADAIAYTKKEYGEKAIITDVDLAETFLRLWRKNSRCDSPYIVSSALLRNEWLLFVTCDYGDYQMWISAAGELKSLSGGLSGDVIPRKN